MSSITTSEQIITTWISKGDNEEDNFSKFISYWVAFNCWLFTVTNEVRDKQALEVLFKREYLYKDFLGLVPQYESTLSKLIAVCPVENNRLNFSKDIKDMQNFPEIIKVIYLIRCNLFHGTKIESSERDEEVVSASIPVLEFILKEVCAKNMLPQ